MGKRRKGSERKIKEEEKIEAKEGVTDEDQDKSEKRGSERRMKIRI